MRIFSLFYFFALSECFVPSFAVLFLSDGLAVAVFSDLSVLVEGLLGADLAVLWLGVALVAVLDGVFVLAFVGDLVGDVWAVLGLVFGAVSAFLLRSAGLSLGGAVLVASLATAVVEVAKAVTGVVEAST